MRIELVSAEHATPEVKRIFESLSPDGKVAPIFQMLAHKPAILRAYTQLTGALWADSSKLPAKLKDLAYLRAAILNGCEY